MRVKGGLMHVYEDRPHAGRVLAQMLREERWKDALLLALPRGGVPIAREISQELGLPYDVLIVRKIGHPERREYGIGAIVEGDEKAYLTDEINFSDPRVLEVINNERKELRRRVAEYRYGQPLPTLKGKEVILVDDGLATGVSALAAGKYLKDKGAAKVVLAVPVAPAVDSEQLQRFIDEVVCPLRPESFRAVGHWYRNFSEVSDDEVLTLLRSNRSRENRPFMEGGGI